MKQSIRLGRYATLFAAVLLATSTMTACDGNEPPVDPDPQPTAPAAAGTIQGPTEVAEGGSIELSIAAIEGAETYKWYKDNAEVQNTADRTLTVTAAGTYKVAGVNAVGEGTASADHTVTVAVPALEAPAAAGNITGPTRVVDGESIELTIPEIDRAATYKWYKDDVEVQNTASRTLTVTAGGDYKVAGVNATGEGVASQVRTVTLITAPAAAGTISGPESFAYTSWATLEIAEIEGAETYRWYFATVDEPTNFTEKQNTSERTYEAREPGIYKVAGVNEAGEGTASPEHTVVMTYSPPSVPTEITVNGVVYTRNAQGKCDSTIPLTGGSIDVTITSIYPQNEVYRWINEKSFSTILQLDASPTFTITEAGKYRVYARNNYNEQTGLWSESQSFAFEVVAEVTVPTVAPTVTGPDGQVPTGYFYYLLSQWSGKVTLTASEVAGAATYKWTKTDGTVMQNTSSRTYDVTAQGQYHVCASNSAGDGPNAAAVTVLN